MTGWTLPATLVSPPNHCLTAKETSDHANHCIATQVALPTGKFQDPDVTQRANCGPSSDAKPGDAFGSTPGRCAT